MNSLRVNTAQLEQFRCEGYLVVPNLFSNEEMGEIASETEALLKRYDLIAFGNLRCQWRTRQADHEAILDALDPIVDVASTLQRLAASEVLQEMLSALLLDKVCLLKDRLMWRLPGSPAATLSGEWKPSPQLPKKVLTAVVAIEACDVTSGALELHRNGLTNEVTLASGDTLIYDEHTQCRTGANHSQASARQVHLSYNALSDGGHRREEFYEQWQRSLRANETSPTFFR